MAEQKPNADGYDLLAETMLTDAGIDETRRIEWSPTLAIGHAVRDGDHQASIERFHVLLDPAETRPRDVVVAALAALYAATREHFGREETLMDALPASLSSAAEAHRTEHRDLLDVFSHPVDGWLGGKPSCRSLTHFLYRWLLRHVVTMHRELVGHFGPTGA